jgi:23S rRNA pseudouridine1911/1915/1917 synthase
MVNQILFEDNHIIIVNKNPGDIVQEDIGRDRTLRDEIKDYIKKKYGKPGSVFLGIVHRLDRPVSGAIIFARTSKSLVRLNKIFSHREVEKIYWAVVDNEPKEPEGTLVHFLKKDENKNKAYISKEGVDGAVRAELKYKLIAKSDKYCLLEVELFTGRHHQIRVQLATINCHIKGDLKYGFPRSNPNAGIHLHARKIVFTHPVRNEPVTIIAPPPDDPLWNYFMTILPS